MKLSLLFFSLSLLCCTKQQAQTADAVAIDLTGAICNPLEGQPAGQPYVDIVCVIAQGIETTTGGVINHLAARSVHLRMPASEASAFLAAHKGS